MQSIFTKILVVIISMTICSPAYSGAVVAGLNLEFVESRFGEKGSIDGGLGFHAGYEFREWKNWRFGGQLEYLSGWNSEDDLVTAGEIMYEAISLYATARPYNWPVVFKAGLVNADYKVLQSDLTSDFREVSDTGYAYGVALVIGNEMLRLDLLDFKRMKIGNDTFNSYGISLAIFFAH